MYRYGSIGADGGMSGGGWWFCSGCVVGFVGGWKAFQVSYFLNSRSKVLNLKKKHSPDFEGFLLVRFTGFFWCE